MQFCTVMSLTGNENPEPIKGVSKVLHHKADIAPESKKKKKKKRSEEIAWRLQEKYHEDTKHLG